MEIPLTLIDYLNRAELVYGEQKAITMSLNNPQALSGTSHIKVSLNLLAVLQPNLMNSESNRAQG